MKNQILILLSIALLGGVPKTLWAQETALPELRTAARSAPRDVGAQIALGRALIKAGRLKEAGAPMKRAVKLDDSVETLFEAMRVKFAEGHYKKVRAACRDLAKKDKNHVLTHVCSARALLVWRRASRAFEHVDKALAVNPNHYEAVLAQADAKRLQGDFKGAAAAYTRAIQLEPKRIDAHLGLGLLHLVQRKQAEALVALRTAHKLAPNDPDVQFELGRVLIETSVPEQAVKLLQGALAGRPGWEDATLEYAVAQLKAGQGAQAEASLAKFLEKHAKHPRATAQYGAALVATGKHAEAETVLAAALKLMPNDYDSAYALALLYERTDRAEEAFTQYRTAADFKRESPVALVAAARLGLKLERSLLAGALLDKALERAPRDSHALMLYGDVLRARGDKKAARKYYNRALEGTPPVNRPGIQQRLKAL